MADEKRDFDSLITRYNANSDGHIFKDLCRVDDWLNEMATPGLTVKRATILLLILVVILLLPELSAVYSSTVS